MWFGLWNSYGGYQYIAGAYVRDPTICEQIICRICIISYWERVGDGGGCGGKDLIILCRAIVVVWLCVQKMANI